MPEVEAAAPSAPALTVPTAALPGVPVGAAPTAPPAPSGGAPEISELPDANVEALGDEISDGGTEVLDPPKELWADEQWATWDGSRDTLDERYHPAYDKLTAQHEQAVSSLEKRLHENDETIRALIYGEDDPHAGKDLTEITSARDAAVQRAEAAEAKLAEYESTTTAAAQAKEEAEIAAFRQDHAWVFEDSTDSDVKKAVGKLIGDMSPSQAGEVFKGVEPKKQKIMAESILRGDSIATAKELAALRTAPPVKEKLPEPLPGSEFVNGSTPAAPTDRRKRSTFEVSSNKEARVLMAERMLGL